MDEPTDTSNHEEKQTEVWVKHQTGEEHRYLIKTVSLTYTVTSLYINHDFLTNGSDDPDDAIKYVYGTATLENPATQIGVMSKNHLWADNVNIMIRGGTAEKHGKFFRYLLASLDPPVICDPPIVWSSNCNVRLGLSDNYLWVLDLYLTEKTIDMLDNAIYQKQRCKITLTFKLDLYVNPDDFDEQSGKYSKYFLIGNMRNGLFWHPEDAYGIVSDFRLSFTDQLMLAECPEPSSNSEKILSLLQPLKTDIEWQSN